MTRSARRATTGLAVDLRVRMLVVHQAEGFRERGHGAVAELQPDAVDAAGLYGAGGARRGAVRRRAGPRRCGAGRRWRGWSTAAATTAPGSMRRLATGWPVGSRFVGTPRAGVRTSEYGRDYRVGYGLGVLDRERLNLELEVDAHRRESPMLDGTDHGALARATIRW